MKNKFKIISFLFVLIGFSACEIHDPINDWAEVGQRTPYVYWEIGSTTLKAGSNVSFLAYYYADKKSISSVEVWYDVNRKVKREVICPVLSYSFSISAEEQMRSLQQIMVYNPDTVAWDQVKRSYIINTSFPTSPVLSPTAWADVKPAEFSEERFVKLYTDTFETAFRKGLQTEINKSYYEKMMKIVENFELMDIDAYKALFTKEEDEVTGEEIYTISDENKAMLDNKLKEVSFKDLIYNSSNESYSVNYSSEYNLNAEFRAYDEDGVIGRTDSKVITLN